MISTCASSGGEDDGDDEAKQTDSLGEDENQDHANEQLRLDSIHADAHVSHDSDSEA